MTDKDFKNIEDIKRILKYIKNGKLDVKSWDNIDELKNSFELLIEEHKDYKDCLLYTSPSPRDSFRSRMPSSA